jgi:hypothetical protein
MKELFTNMFEETKTFQGYLWFHVFHYVNESLISFEELKGG